MMRVGRAERGGAVRREDGREEQREGTREGEEGGRTEVDNQSRCYNHHSLTGSSPCLKNS